MNLTFDIAGVAALLLALITLYKTFQTGKLEATNKKSDVTRALQELTDSTIEKNITLRRRVQNLENQITELRGDITKFTILCGRCARDNLQKSPDPEIQELLGKYRDSK